MRLKSPAPIWAFKELKFMFQANVIAVFPEGNSNCWPAPGLCRPSALVGQNELIA